MRFFASPIGAEQDPLEWLEVFGDTSLGGDVVTSDYQTYHGPVTLTGGTETILTNKNASNAVTFENIIGGAGGLTIKGNTVFKNNIGSANFPLAFLTITGTTGLGGNITMYADGTVDFGQAVTGTNTDLKVTADKINVGGDVTTTNGNQEYIADEMELKMVLAHLRAMISLLILTIFIITMVV